MTRVLRKRPRARVVVAGRKATLGVTMARNKKAAAPSRESAVAPLQQFDPIPLTAPASAAAVIASPQPSPGASPAIFRALRQRPKFWMSFIALVDAGLIATALGVAARMRFSGEAGFYQEFSSQLFGRGLLFASAMVFAMFALGLYQPQTRESARGMLLRQAVAFGIGAVLLTITYYAIPQAYLGRGVLALAALIGFVLVAAWRVVAMNLMNVDLLRRRILIFGAGSCATFVAQRMRRRSDRQTLTIVGFVPIPGEAVQVPAEQLVQVEPTLSDWAAEGQIDEIVVVPDDRRGNLPMDELLACRQRGIDVTDLVSFLERESGKVKLTAMPSWLVFSAGFNASPWRRTSKRLFDITVAAVVAALTWPLMLLVVLAIRLESGPGQPILYYQDRVGERGRVFRLYKFRSMHTDAELGGVARWASKNDERVTRVGRVIRKLRLDELPQLWNVLAGTMSFIGPRPERPQFVQELNERIPYYALRHCVKPGLTGWAQLRYPYGASVEDAAEKLTFDLFYVKNHTFNLDLLILIQTVEIVLFGRGAR